MKPAELAPKGAPSRETADFGLLRNHPLCSLLREESRRRGHVSVSDASRFRSRGRRLRRACRTGRSPSFHEEHIRAIPSMGSVVPRFPEGRQKRVPKPYGPSRHFCTAMPQPGSHAPVVSISSLVDASCRYRHAANPDCRMVTANRHHCRWTPSAPTASRRPCLRLTLQASPPTGKPGGCGSGVLGTVRAVSSQRDSRRLRWIIASGLIPTLREAGWHSRGSWRRTHLAKIALRSAPCFASLLSGRPREMNALTLAGLPSPSHQPGGR